jgi:dCTP deaminase
MNGGILPAQKIRQAIEDGWIGGDPPADDIQPASLDLRLGAKAYALRCSFLPDDQVSIETKLEDLALTEFDIRHGAVLERNRPYLIPLAERVALPADVRGRTNPKSSTGRIDVFTRVISEGNFRFDEIPAGYEGPLFLEIVSRSFAIRVQERLPRSSRVCSSLAALPRWALAT